MDAKEQNRIILDMIDFKWDMNWIRDQFGEIVPEVNYEQNILKILSDIQAEDGYYFLKRQDMNREIRNKIAFMEEIAQALPENYDAKIWELKNLGDLYKQIETIRLQNSQIEKAVQVVNNQGPKIRSFEAGRDIALATLDKETTYTRNSTESEIQKLEAQIVSLKKDLGELEEKKQDKRKVIEHEFKANEAKHQSLVDEYRETSLKKTVDISDLSKEATETEKMKSFVNEHKRMLSFEVEIETLKKRSDAMTEKIEKARTLPGEILKNSNIPIDGLSVKDGRALINGLPISNLSDGEKMDLCFSVATQSPNRLNLILIDGIEKLSSTNREKIYGSCKEKGIQFLATRTSDSAELTVIEI